MAIFQKFSRPQLRRDNMICWWFAWSEANIYLSCSIGGTFDSPVFWLLSSSQKKLSYTNMPIRSEIRFPSSLCQNEHLTDLLVRLLRQVRSLPVLLEFRLVSQLRLNMFLVVPMVKFFRWLAISFVDADRETVWEDWLYGKTGMSSTLESPLFLWYSFGQSQLLVGRPPEHQMCDSTRWKMMVGILMVRYTTLCKIGPWNEHFILYRYESIAFSWIVLKSLTSII